MCATLIVLAIVSGCGNSGRASSPPSTSSSRDANTTEANETTDVVITTSSLPPENVTRFVVLKVETGSTWTDQMGNEDSVDPGYEAVSIVLACKEADATLDQPQDCGGGGGLTDPTGTLADQLYEFNPTGTGPFSAAPQLLPGMVQQYRVVYKVALHNLEAAGDNLGAYQVFDSPNLSIKKNESGPIPRWTVFGASNTTKSTDGTVSISVTGVERASVIPTDADENMGLRFDGNGYRVSLHVVNDGNTEFDTSIGSQYIYSDNGIEAFEGPLAGDLSLAPGTEGDTSITFAFPRNALAPPSNQVLLALSPEGLPIGWRASGFTGEADGALYYPRLVITLPS